MTASVETMSSSPTTVKALTSARGVEAWHVESDVVPLIAVSFIFEGGSAHDPADKPGVAQMLARLLDEGAGEYDSDAFQERLAAHAIELSFNAGNDALGGSLKTLVKHADEAFELLRLALAEPRFDQDSIERVRAQTIAGLKYQQNDPGVMATRRFFEEGFAGHPYGRPTSGTPESVAAITRDDLIDMHKAIIARGRVKVAVVGAIGSDNLSVLLDKVFGSLPEAEALSIIEPASLQMLGSRIVVDLDVPQSVIRFGMNGIAWRDPGFIPAYVLNHILGGGAFTSRLFQEVREKRGLAYSVYSYASHYADTGQVALYVGTRPDNVGEALDVIGSELRRLVDDGVTEEELDRARDNVKGRTVLSMESTLTRMNRLGSSLLMGVPILTVDELLASFDAVTMEDVMTLARELFAPDRLSAAGI
ncbi:MAG: M16 family metallopeptidase, partial [Microvirga sp.]